MDFNLLEYPMVLRDPRYLPGHRSWLGHIPFAFALVEMMRPESIVELGVYQGSSYCAFCQAVAELELRSTRCFGIDTWKGDEHTGEVGMQVLAHLRAHHDPLYSSFSQFVPTDFDSAAAHVAEGTIDLLHIDGLHTYEAVRHDFETWLPKMSEYGVVLFHDTAMREKDFGVWRLWEELRGKYPSFEFMHSFGLGVLAVGGSVATPVVKFLAAANEQPQRMRRAFEVLGERIQDERILRTLGDFLTGTQQILDFWKAGVGATSNDQPVDAHRSPIDAALRIFRDLKSLRAGVQQL